MTRLIAACSVVLTLVAGPSFAQLRADLVASGLSQPVAFVQHPSQPEVQLIVEQGGRVRVLQAGILRPDAFLDLSSQVLFSGERGLLGLAFAPDYATSGRVFVNFVNLAGNTVIARFRRSAGDPLRADAGTQFNLVWPDGNAFIAQPFTNHKGGHLAFGPDGYLYIGMGDGGSGDDPGHRAQNPLTLLGKMLRIDPSVAGTDPEGYDVPADNPFAGSPGVLPEIWAFGLRNPWRWSFDDPSRGGTGALVIADVGQGAWEEIDYEPAGSGGRNYGWRNREGAHDYVTTLPPFFTPLTDPIFEYSHATGRSVTGGHVYRGTAMGASYNGRYFFGDFVNGRIWSLGLAINATSGEASAADVAEHTAELGAAAASPSSFGADANGELYVLSYNAGAVYRVVSSSSPSPSVDFTRDLRSDILWRHATLGEVWLWPMSGAAKVLELPVRTVADTNWEVRGQGDQDGDGQADILWRNRVTGEVYFWPMNGSTPHSETSVATVDPAYDIVGTGDFDGDGMSDILWRHTALGDVWIWLMDGATPLGEVFVDRVDPAYVVKGAGDLDGNGKADIVWHGAAGDVWVWLMNGTTRLSQTWVARVPDTTYQIQEVADFDGNGRADLLWWNTVRGEVWIWPMNGAARLGEMYVATVPDTNYRVMAAGDYDGNRKADILWRHIVQGDVWVWEMDGTTRLSENYIGTVPDMGYQIVRAK